jgi:hypothetical protein
LLSISLGILVCAKNFFCSYHNCTCLLWSHHCYRFLQASESEWLEISEDDDEDEDEADDDDDDESGEDADQTDEDEVYLST